MTIDERLNNLEDQIRRIKDIINGNNEVARKLNVQLREQVKALQDQITELKNRPAGIQMGDNFFGSGFGGK